MLDRADAKLLFTVTDFLDTDYVDAARSGATRSPSLEQIVVLRGHARGGHVAWDDFLAARRDRRRAEIERARGRAHRRRPLRHPLHVGHDRPARRARCSRTARACAAYDAWSTSSACATGDRYLDRQPVLPLVRAEGRASSPCLIKGATIVPHAVFDVDAVMQRVAEERISMLPGPPTIYQSILDHPRRRRVRPVVAAARGHRRGRRCRSS